MIVVTTFSNLLPILALLSFSLEPSNALCRNEKYRPQFHFSVPANWNNDPNGMVYLDGEYHLFYQYHPYSTQWGPMHWGHAVSTNLTHWTDLDIALYPDELGTIFSGSAVVDSRNTSGLATTPGVNPIIAVFTHDGPTTQVQSIAVSNDRGREFVKYQYNPVIPNPGIRDFRDPKVLWVNDHWVQVLAVFDRIYFYTSSNLITWSKASEFGADPEDGSHGGVWECPDLIPLEFLGDTVWVLLVSINPGGPNFGSATQYFLGSFDGYTFYSWNAEGTGALWMDWGPDNYAGVSFSGEPNGRAIVMSWMNNWAYAGDIPTGDFRGQMTLPRVLTLGHAEGRVRLMSNPVQETTSIRNSSETYRLTNQEIPAGYVMAPDIPWRNAKLEVDLNVTVTGAATMGLRFLNEANREEISVEWDARRNEWILDRSKSGNTGFHQNFSPRAYAPRQLSSITSTVKVFLDVSSIEVFADGGLTTLTGLYFPTGGPLEKVEVVHWTAGTSRVYVNSLDVHGLNSIYDC